MQFLLWWEINGKLKQIDYLRRRQTRYTNLLYPSNGQSLSDKDKEHDYTIAHYLLTPLGLAPFTCWL